MLSCTTKVVFKEEAYRSVPAMEPLAPVSEVHYVFSNRDLLSTSMGQAKTITMVYNVLGVSCTTSTNNSNKSASCLALGFLLDGLGLLE